MKRLVYISGTRADFGLMQRTLQALSEHPQIDLGVCVTGMHLSDKFGHTADDIKASGLKIVAELPIPMDAGTALEMASGFGLEAVAFSKFFANYKPDAILVLGDRGEMLAAAIAAVHFGIPVLHIGGGERSGTIDESIRHALSKFAHYHFVTTDLCKDRLIKMGEEPDSIYRISAPGLDTLADFKPLDKNSLFEKLGLDTTQQTAMCLFHPVVQRADDAGAQMLNVLEALKASGVQCLVLEPNADAGNQNIRDAITQANTGFKRITHLERDVFLACFAHFDVLVGNSSSGIIEAASFGLPVVNIGTRQNGRERNANTIDVAPKTDEIKQAIATALANGRTPKENIYGMSDCFKKLPSIIAGLNLAATKLEKMNTY